MSKVILEELWTEELLGRLDVLRNKLHELAAGDPVAFQMLIEGLIVGHAYAAAGGDEIKACYFVESMSKHAKQFIAGKNMIVEGGHRRK